MRAWLARHGRAGPWAAWLWAALCVLGLRLALGLVLAGAWWVLRPYLPIGAGSVWQQAALDMWVRWDAVHYLTLADVGYAGVSVGDTVFYPLYPALVGAAAKLLPVTAAGLLVSTGAAVAALAGVHVLAERHYGPAAGRWAATALAVYPTALFLVAPFTEALFLALTVWAFVLAERERWPAAGALAGLAALTRGPGLLTVPALAWLAVTQWRAAGGKAALAVRAGLGLALAAGGGLAFLVYRQAQGWPPMGVVLRAYSGVELLNPVRGVSYAVAQVLRVPDLPTVLDMASAIVFGGLLLVMARQTRWRNGAWLVYFGLNLLFDLSKHSLTAAAWQSLARYVLVLFPAFIAAGDWLARQTRRVRFAYLTFSSAGLLGLSALYALWFFVG
ncbi:MAG: hypothetical protein IT317_07810 [Anaerolineales bacterium]|nr:hypothetical protein [Anaerolineales bacterium]